MADDVQPTAHAEYVSKAMEKFRFVTADDNEDTFVYRRGVYKPNAEAVIRAWTEKNFKDADSSAKRDFCNEVLHAVKRRTYTTRDSFNPGGKLCLLNGILDLGALTIEPHTPDTVFTVQLPVAFDPSATCPAFLRFLAWALPDESAQETVRRLFGYCLVASNPHQLAFMFVGDGDNGKTTLLNILKGLLGKDNVAAETLQALSDNRFAAANLWSKLANIAADLPSSAIKYTGTFKALTGGDLVRGEKKHQTVFYFENPAKLIFSCNELPEVNDKSYAFWRRWILLPFTSKVDANERDPDLADKILAEGSGILNWALAGLRALREVNGFPQASSAKNLMEDWKKRADTLYWFITEEVIRDPKGWVAKDDFYEAYSEFCDARAVRTKRPEIVGKELPLHVPQVRQERHRVDGSVVRGWSGVVLRAEIVEPATLDTPDTAGQTTLPEGLVSSVSGGPDTTHPPQIAVETAPVSGEAGVSGSRNLAGKNVSSDPQWAGAKFEAKVETGLETRLAALHRKALETLRWDPKRPASWIVSDLAKAFTIEGDDGGVVRVVLDSIVSRAKRDFETGKTPGGP